MVCFYIKNNNNKNKYNKDKTYLIFIVLLNEYSTIHDLTESWKVLYKQNKILGKGEIEPFESNESLFQDLERRMAILLKIIKIYMSLFDFLMPILLLY